MSFLSREISRFLGQPVELYAFKYGPGAGDVFLYTNNAQAISYGGVTYEPTPIKRGEIVATGGLDKTTIDVTVPDSIAIADLYKGEPPSNVVTLIIRQGHVGDADFKVCWAGKVLSGTFGEIDLKLDCEPISSSLRRSGLTRDYQYACPHVLYGPQCRASKAAATSVKTVVSVSGPLVTLGADWVPVARQEKYVGGIAEWTVSGRTVRRSIIKAPSNGVIMLSSEATGLLAGAALTVILGCNHLHGIRDTVGDCKNLHNNILNFGGQHEIPLTNPMGVVNNYY